MSQTKLGEARLAPLLQVINKHPEGISFPELKAALSSSLAVGDDALKYRHKTLVDSGRVSMQGARRWARYLPIDSGSTDMLQSPESRELVRCMNRPTSDREPASYSGALIESYEPNISRYLFIEDQRNLETIGTDLVDELPAGTYARRIMDRLLIDLSWNRSDTSLATPATNETDGSII